MSMAAGRSHLARCSPAGVVVIHLGARRWQVDLTRGAIDADDVGEAHVTAIITVSPRRRGRGWCVGTNARSRPIEDPEGCARAFIDPLKQPTG